MIMKIIKICAPRKRVRDNQDPRLNTLFAQRYKYISLDRAKLTFYSRNQLLSKRDLRADFQINNHGKLAIIIPFRNREAHLEELLPRLREKLNEQQIDYHVFIVDQVDQKPFNRAKLINVGVDYAKANYDYFSMHDVDLLPVDALYACPSLPLRPTGSIRTSTGERNIANTNLGGILTLKKEHFLSINGMSNNFWHWGKEDENLLFRLLSKGINPVLDVKGVYDEIDDSTDRFKVIANNKVTVDKKAATRMIAANKRYQDRVARGLIPACDEGLSSLTYELQEVIHSDADLTRLKVLL